MRLMFIGAHPDDGDGRAGGLAARCVERGGEALFVSTTNGNAGHHEMVPDELARRRREEARRAGEVIGADYLVLDHDDGKLSPAVAIREELIGLIRDFNPDLLLGLRPVDYHPDHRAAGELVMDASYMLTVPLIRPDVRLMRRMPVIACVYDGFKKPMPFQPDVMVAVDEYFEKKARMLACHRSQFYEWIPYNGMYLDEVPESEDERWEWFRKRCEARLRSVADMFRDRLVDRYGSGRGQEIEYAEAFEISEYGRQPDAELVEALFPR
jgi:LmbE family N-acetylglucosaminyl deacetylase